MKRRSPLLVIFVTVFVDMLGYGIMLPLLPFYVQRQAGGAAIVGSIGALYALMQLISGPGLGALSDRYGRRPVLLTCLFGTSMAFLLLGLANTLPLIYLAIMLDGITGGNLTTAYAYIADITPPGRRTRGMGMVGAAFGLGLMAGPALGGLLSRFGLGAPAFAASAIALLNVVFGLFVLPESLPPEKRSSAIPTEGLHFVAHLRALFKLGRIRLLLAAIFTLNLAFSGLQTNFPLFSQARFQWDAGHNGLFYAYVGFLAVFVQGALLGWILPRVGEKRLAAFGLAMMAVGLAGVALAAQDWLLYPLVGMVAFGSGISIPSLTGLASNQVDSSEQGRLMGGMQVLLSLTTIIGPVAAGLTFEYIGVPAPYWLGGLLAAAAFWLARRGIKALH